MLARLPTPPGRPGFYIAICSHAEIQAEFAADSDAEAIERAREECGESLTCDLTVADAARAAGVRVTPMSDKQMTRLVVAAMLPAAMGTMSEEAFERTDVTRYLFACAGFAWSGAWNSDLATHFYDVHVNGPGLSRRFTLVFEPEGAKEGPGFELVTPGTAFSEKRRRKVELVVVVRREMDAFRQILLRGLGTDRFPLGVSLRKGPPDATLLEEEVLILTGVLECIAQLTTAAPHAQSDVDGVRVTIGRLCDDARLLGPIRGTA